MRITIVAYPDGTDRPGVPFDCANGYIGRCVSAVAAENIHDADWLCRALNDAHSAGILPRHAADEPVRERAMPRQLEAAE